jgi:hypothetical protein
MVNCKEIARLLASDGLADAALPLRARARLHLLFCRHCRGYAAQLKAVGVAGRELWGSCTGEHETLERLEQSILDQALGENREDHT